MNPVDFEVRRRIARGAMYENSGREFELWGGT